MVRCPRCQRLIPLRTDSCPDCGWKVVSSSDDGHVPGWGSSPPLGKTAPESADGVKKYLPVIILLVVLVAAGGLAWRYLIAKTNDARDYAAGPETSQDHDSIREGSSDEPPAAPASHAGNTPGNIANGGLIAEQDGWLYMIDGGHLIRKRPDQSEEIVLADKAMGNINVVGSWVFFTNEDGGLCRLALEGDKVERQATVIYKNGCASVNVLEDAVYFIDVGSQEGSSSIRGSICRMSLTGDQYTEIMQGEQASQIICYKDWLYFVSLDAGGRICRIKLEGHNAPEIVVDNRTRCFDIYEDSLYYVDESAGRKLIKADIDGGNPQVLVEDRVGTMNIGNGWIYFSNASNGGSLYRVSVDGGSSELIDEDSPVSINLGSKSIYIEVDNDSSYLKRIDIYEGQDQGTWRNDDDDEENGLKPAGL